MFGLNDVNQIGIFLLFTNFLRLFWLFNFNNLLLLSRKHCLNIVDLSNNWLIATQITSHGYLLVAFRILGLWITLLFLLLLFSLIFKPLLSSLDPEISELDLVLDIYLLDLDLDSAHLDYIILFEQVVLHCIIILNLKKPHHIIHSFFHLDRRERWLSSLQIKVINVMQWIRWQHSLDEIFVPNLVNFK